MESKEYYNNIINYIENFRERIWDSCYRKTICKTNDYFDFLGFGYWKNDVRLGFGNRLGYWGTGAWSNLNSDRHRINTSIRVK